MSGRIDLNVHGLRGAVLLLLIGLATGASAATVKVDARDTTPDAGGCGGKGNACNTIQAGVDNADPGDVVAVAKGVYPELVVVDRGNITLRGAGTITQPTGLAAECEDDPARTSFRACPELETEPECDAAWAITREFGSVDRVTPQQYASCYWSGTACRICDREAEFEGSCANTCDPLPVASMLVTAPGVRVEKLRFEAIGDGPLTGGGRAGIVVTEAGEGATIQKVRMDGVAGDCIVSLAPRTMVERTTLRACGGHCIEVRGALSAVTRNRVRQCDGSGISATGGDLLVARNSVLLTDSSAIRFGGEGILVERNRLSASEDMLVEGAGARFAVTRNKARLAQEEGFDVDCDAVPADCSADPTRTTFAGWSARSGSCDLFVDEPSCGAAWAYGDRFRATSCYWDATATVCRSCVDFNEDDGECINACRGAGARCIQASVAQNRIEATLEEECMDLSSAGPGLVAERNKAALCAEEGIDVDGVEIVLRGNQVSDCGSRVRSHHGFEITGPGHVIEGNTAQRCAGDGFSIERGAVGVTLARNKALDNGGDGFDVAEEATGTEIDRALARGNTGNGIEVSAGGLDTRVTSSRASGHPLDFCDEGTGTISSSNRFSTTGTSCSDP